VKRALTLALPCALSLLAGCATWSPRSLAAEHLAARADTLAEQGDVHGAARVYAKVVSQYPETPAASRARMVGDTLAAVDTLTADLAARDAELGAARRDIAAREAALAARAAELAAREADIVRLQQEVAARDAELTRVRADVAARQAEIAARQAEITRLAAESERLRADLEQLNRLDLRLEQSGARRR
jgi:uncharacterized protein (DUF3084 family)